MICASLLISISIANIILIGERHDIPFTTQIRKELGIAADRGSILFYEERSPIAYIKTTSWTIGEDYNPQGCRLDSIVYTLYIFVRNLHNKDFSEENALEVIKALGLFSIYKHRDKIIQQMEPIIRGICMHLFRAENFQKKSVYVGRLGRNGYHKILFGRILEDLDNRFNLQRENGNLIGKRDEFFAQRILNGAQEFDQNIPLYVVMGRKHLEGTTKFLKEYLHQANIKRDVHEYDLFYDYAPEVEEALGHLILSGKAFVNQPNIDRLNEQIDQLIGRDERKDIKEKMKVCKSEF